MMEQGAGSGVLGNFGSRLAAAALSGLLLLLACVNLLSGCLDRPVAETRPATSNIFVDEIVQASVDKIDLLFMIDNSASMADKQEILKSAVPVLLNRLTSPICVDEMGVTHGNFALGKCAVGKPEFQPVADIHVGIVTSSLGSHGGQVCASGKPGETPNDRAHLLGTVRSAGSNPEPSLMFDAAKTWNNSGFLAWDPDQKDQPVPGERAPDKFKGAFQDMIAAAGENGCGFEASLESWYRFLIDPEPPASVTKDASASPKTVRGSQLVIHADGSSTCEGCDQELLAQRKAFLRPDSLVLIVMLSDENDCSIRDDGQGWLVGTTSSGPSSYHLPRAAEACQRDANDPCCRSCGVTEAAPPAGCQALSVDPGCVGTEAQSDEVRDATSLRCFEQKRRFGIDLLYPTSRYVEGLTSPILTLQSDGKTKVTNPLFDSGTSGKSPRSPSLVFLSGIVGVPWQDIADDTSLTGPGLTYLNASELVSRGRWSVLLGDPKAQPPVPPSDPFMIESPLARPGKNPITMDAIMPASSTSQTASPINGHEQNLPKQDDLQYACTFALTTERPCPAGDTTCDCDATKAQASNTPLCRLKTADPPSYVQTFAKAYPGTRELQVLQALEAQAIVASICPKVRSADDPLSDPNYGYNPAVGAIIERLKSPLQGKCLPRALASQTAADGGPEVTGTGQVACQVIETRASGCDCNLPGRKAVSPESSAVLASIRSQLQVNGSCDVAGKPACDSFCQCEVRQESGADLTACQKNQDPEQPGYCYIDDPSSPAVANCPANQKRILRFADTPSNRIPANGAIAFIACLGAPLQSEASASAP